MVFKQWDKIKLVCGNHGDDFSNVMEIKDGKIGMTPFYKCPKYISIYSEAGGHSCNNRLNMVDFERMLEYITDEKYTDDGDIVSVKGLKWKKNGIEYKVIEDTTDEITVVMKNNKAIGR